MNLDSDNDNEQLTWRSFTLKILSNELTFTAFREVYDRHEFKTKVCEGQGLAFSPPEPPVCFRYVWLPLEKLPQPINLLKLQTTEERSVYSKNRI